MPNLTEFLRTPRLPFLANMTASVGLVGGGLVMAHFLRLAACPLCIVQRMLYMVIALIAFAGLLAFRIPAARRLLAGMMGLAAAAGIVAAGYQTWIQRFAPMTTCGADMPWYEQLVEWAGQQLPVLFLSTGLCSDPAWRFLGLSIAEWSLAAFTGMAVLSLLALLRRD
ncbi:MAG: disulfide bond formation protein B [Rhodocyclaceae bacterium]|nr:disulfide bond formation protein B [Rhodocyclaceae bacterium]